MSSVRCTVSEARQMQKSASNKLQVDQPVSWPTALPVNAAHQQYGNHCCRRMVC